MFRVYPAYNSIDTIICAFTNYDEMMTFISNAANTLIKFPTRRVDDLSSLEVFSTSNDAIDYYRRKLNDR